MPLGTEIVLSPVDIVLDRDPAPPKGYGPQFSANVYCGQWSPISASAELLLRSNMLFDVVTQLGTTVCFFNNLYVFSLTVRRWCM